MRKLDWIMLTVTVLGLGALALVPGAAAEKVEQKIDSGKIAELVKKLGSDSFEEREGATKELDAIGAPALEALKKATKSDDAEIQKRADELVKIIEKRVETARLLAPTMIQLKYKDTSVKEAVADLAKKTGYNIYLHDPDNKLGDRTVTLETAEISFWEAFDKFCNVAKLVEANPQDVPGQVLPPPPWGIAAPPAPGGLPVAPAPVPVPLPIRGAPLAPPALAPPVPVAPPVGPGPVPVPAFLPRRPRPGLGVTGFAPGTIVLMDGTPKEMPTYYAGAIRFRALPADINVIKPTAEEQVFILEVTPEPKLQWLGLAGLNIQKAVDELGQSLAQSTAKEGEGDQGKAAPPNAGPRGDRIAPPFTGWNTVQQQVPARLKKGEKEAKLAKKVQGVVSAQLRTPDEPLITVDNILKAAGTTVKGDKGGSLKVLEASKDDDGVVKIRVEVDYPAEIIPAGGGGGAFGGGRIGVGGGVIILPGGGGVVPPGGGIRIVPVPVPVPAPPVPVPPAPVSVPPGEDGAVGFGGKLGVTIAVVRGGNKLAAPVPVAAPLAPAPVPPGVKAPPPPVPVPVPPGGAGPALRLPIGGGVGGTPGMAPGVEGLTLVDDKGKVIAPSGVGMSVRGGPAGFVREVQLQFKLDKDAPAPAKLIFNGSSTVTVDIPFTLKNVPLQK
jgi:hypothetical protein